MLHASNGDLFGVDVVVGRVVAESFVVPVDFLGTFLNCSGLESPPSVGAVAEDDAAACDLLGWR